MTPDIKELNRICKNIERAVRIIPGKTAVIAVKFSKERFREKKWINKREHPWTKTNKRRGSTLIKSGRLKESIHTIHIGADYAIIGTDVPYARAHNDGGTFTGTETVRAHDRRSHKRKAHTTRSGKRIKAGTVRTHAVKSHQRSYKRTFIKRQFLGQSQYLTNQLTNMIQTEIQKAVQL